MHVLARYATPAEAHLAQARLETAGIESWIEGGHLSGNPGSMGGVGEVWLKVRNDDHDAAREALYDCDDEPTEDPELRAALLTSRRRVRIAIVCLFSISVLALLLFAIFVIEW